MFFADVHHLVWRVVRGVVIGPVGASGGFGGQDQERFRSVFMRYRVWVVQGRSFGNRPYGAGR